MSEFAHRAELRTLHDVVEALERDPNVGYYHLEAGSVLAFGDGGLGDMGIVYAREHGGMFETGTLVLYHNQEPALIGWLLATVAQGMDRDELNAFHADLMARIAAAELSVRPAPFHHESFGAPYWGGMAARDLAAMLHDPSLYQPSTAWNDAHSLDDTRPGIRMRAELAVREVEITDEFAETRFTLSYTQAIAMAVGLTVYDRGRLRPEIMKQVYDGLIAP